mmetsp:Transcript_16088/g.43859  ORF Transcript_16088/g.43859 Transcript_16088/m.43859 type:complete len:89 (+) Transcript_16088:89-355(+)|eukprot:413213-Pelagomonas_calceolata.AAC.1
MEQQRALQHESSMEESSGSSRGAAVMEGSIGEAGDRQDFFAKGECVEGVPKQLYVTSLFVAFTTASGNLANHQIVLFKGKTGQNPLHG